MPLFIITIKMKLKLLGFRDGGKITMSFPTKYKEMIPPYFVLELDLKELKNREKGDKK